MSCHVCLKEVSKGKALVLKTPEREREFCSVSCVATFCVTANRQLRNETEGKKEAVLVS